MEAMKSAHCFSMQGLPEKGQVFTRSAPFLPAPGDNRYSTKKNRKRARNDRQPGEKRKAREAGDSSSYRGERIIKREEHFREGTKMKWREKQDDAFIIVQRDRRFGFGGGSGGIRDGWTVRMGRVSDENSGATLAARGEMERYSDADRRGFL